MKSRILDLNKKFIENQTNIIKNLQAKKEVACKLSDYNAIITNLYDEAIKQAETTKYNFGSNLLAGIDYTLKDNVSTEGIATTGGSLFLKNYVPSFSATIYNIFNKNQCILTSKTNLDEFGLGGTGTHSAYGKVKNFYNENCISGGSSSGGVVAVSSNMATFAIGTDTGDSIRRPSSLCNTVGYKPTYGLVSRYGVLPYAPSLDHVGTITSTVADAAIVAEKIIEFDNKDFTSQNKKNIVSYNKLKELNNIKFVVVKNLLKNLKQEEKTRFENLIKKINEHGHEIVYVDCDESLINAVAITYKILSYAEATSCYGNMTGLLFGEDASNGDDNFEAKLYKNRTAFFSNELKRRFTIGAFLIKKENYNELFLKSKKIRTLIINDLKRMISCGDCVLMPSTASVAQSFDLLENDITWKSNQIDQLLTYSNFAGTPSISIPYTFINEMPWGINITCDTFEDQKMLNIALTLESLIDEMEGNDEQF